MVWPHSASGRFLLNRYIPGLFRALPPLNSGLYGKLESPKIKIFMWQAIRGRLPVADQIQKWNGPGSDHCVLCSDLEDTNHIFFGCVLAKMAWCCIRSWMGVSWAPNSFAELRVLTDGLQGQSKHLFWLGFAALCWALWTTRNKFTIEHVFPNKPADCIFKMCMFFQQWRSLTKVADWDALEVLIAKV